MHLSLWALSPNSSNILLVFIRVFLIVFLIVIITQWFSDSFPLNLFKSYAEKPCVMWLWFDEIVKHVMWQDLMRLWKIHFEFPGLARNQPWSHPWSNPIRQLDLTNWQTEHSATSSTSLKALFNFSAEFLQPCKLSKSFDRTWTNVNLQYQPLIQPDFSLIWEKVTIKLIIYNLWFIWIYNPFNDL